MELEEALGPIVEQQIAEIVLTIAAAINDIFNRDIIDWDAAEVIDAVDIDAIVAEIIANVEVSLQILEDCLEAGTTIEIEALSTQSVAQEPADA